MAPGAGTPPDHARPGGIGGTVLARVYDACASLLGCTAGGLDSSRLRLAGQSSAAHCGTVRHVTRQRATVIAAGLWGLLAGIVLGASAATVILLGGIG